VYADTPLRRHADTAMVLVAATPRQVLASWREVLLLRLGGKSLLRFVESFLPMEGFVGDSIFDPLDPLV
jgi:hypothetical protein